MTSDDVDVVISLDPTDQGPDSLIVKRFDPLILQLIGTTRDQDFDEIHMDVEDVADIPTVVDHIARFHYYLRWSTSPKERIKALGPPDNIKLRLYKLDTRNGMCVVKRCSKDHFSGRSVGSVDAKLPYGIKISKDTDGCIYLSLFSFNPKTYEIEVSKQSGMFVNCITHLSLVMRTI